jgi:C1A family cysteine protease
MTALPPSVDLRDKCPPIYDQARLNSCTANAIAAAVEFDQMKQNETKVFMPSRLFIYYNERSMEGSVGADNGAMIRDGIKSVGKQGDCPEDSWPYDAAKVFDKPSASCYTDAIKHKAVAYQRVTRDLNQMKACLADGFPFVFGFTVYASFMSAEVERTGRAAMPVPGEGGPNGEPPGGHAVMAVGYEDANQWFIVRNSWGTGWGMSGYFTLPYAYLTTRGLAADFWTIRVTT